MEREKRKVEKVDWGALMDEMWGQDSGSERGEVDSQPATGSSDSGCVDVETRFGSEDLSSTTCFTPSNSIPTCPESKPRKLFPVFENVPLRAPGVRGGRKRKGEGQGALERKRSRKTLRGSHGDKKENLEQLHLDLGQKTFGHVTCAVCGMVYTFGQPDDQVEHIKFHKKFLAGVRFPGWKQERVVGLFGDGRIIVILHTDPKHHLKKVEEVCTVVDSELGYATGTALWKRRSKVFLYVSYQKRVLGCVVAEEITQGCRVLPPENGEADSCLSAWFCSTSPEPALVGINRIWVSAHCRRQGVATRLVDTVRSSFLAGYVVPREELAFSDPTPDGRAFASRYCRTASFLVYQWT